MSSSLSGGALIASLVVRAALVLEAGWMSRIEDECDIVFFEFVEDEVVLARGKFSFKVILSLSVWLNMGCILYINQYPV